MSFAIRSAIALLFGLACGLLLQKPLIKSAPPAEPQACVITTVPFSGKPTASWSIEAERPCPAVVSFRMENRGGAIVIDMQIERAAR